MKSYDVIVLGLGAMGSAACHHLAGRGQKVLGLEQFSLGHDRGSSHGETRLIRKAYFENPSYVPLLLRAYELWDELAAEAEEEILVRSGLVIYGRPETSPVLRGTLASGRQYGIGVEEVSRADARTRWPLFACPEGFSAVFEAGAGFLHAERAVHSHARLARRRGAELREGETVLGWEATANGVRVRTNQGGYEAARLVVTAGSWATRLLGELGLPLTIRRMLLAWFHADGHYRREAGAPCFVFDLDDDFYYGFPSLDGRTVKMAGHHGYELLSRPEEKDDTGPKESRLEALRAFTRACLPGVSAELAQSAHCLYTMTPDENFIVDRHPRYPQVSYAAGFSGHGFKFASVMGEILADLALEGGTRHPVSFLRASRFPALQA